MSSSCEHNQRCSGHCCRRFYLPYTPEELQAMVDGTKSTGHRREELEQVAGMVIPLKPAKEYEFLVDGVTPVPADARGYYYTCKHHDEATGNCLNYENRPNMCSAFPFYGNPSTRCEYKECTWEDGRNPVIPADSWLLTRKLGRKYQLSKAAEGEPVPAALIDEIDSCTKEAAA